MSTQNLTQSLVATTPAIRSVSSDNSHLSATCMSASAILLLLLAGLAVFSKRKLNKLEKKLKFEQLRSQEARKQLRLALETIRRIETNPDLINSRELNLDYLRMRMTEDVFHSVIVGQIKVKVKEQISQALRRCFSSPLGVGVVTSSGEQRVNEILEVEYEAGVPPYLTKCVLFRVQVRLMKLPAQTNSSIVKEVIDCIERYLSPAENYDTWQPTIQGRLVYIHWDQKAKPTPMLVIEQTYEGVNVSFRTNRQIGAVTFVEKETFA